MELRNNIEKSVRKYLNEQEFKNNSVIAYHGTPHGRFEKFSMRKRGSGADLHSVGDYGKGFYFSSNKEHAIAYATKISNKRSDIKEIKPTLYTVELRMNKPFDMRILSNIQKRHILLSRKYGVLNIPQSEFDNMYNELGITEDDADFYSEVESLIDDNWGDWDIKNKLKERGYDSIINQNGSEYIVYSPKQIKILDVEEL